MTWNYRVTKRKILGEDVFEIREVYYDKKGKVEAWSGDAIEPCATSKVDLQKDLVRMVEATTKPIIDLDELEANSSQAGQK